eukprot:scaffold231065_cov30-Tisochrysis_lutea.AAC.1
MRVLLRLVLNPHASLAVEVGYLRPERIEVTADLIGQHLATHGLGQRIVQAIGGTVGAHAEGSVVPQPPKHRVAAQRYTVHIEHEDRQLEWRTS